MAEEKNVDPELTGTAESEERTPSLMRNYVSFIGIAIVLASLSSVFLLFMMELTGGHDNPYVGLLTYIIFPSIMMFGIAVVITGMILERRRRHRSEPGSIMAYPMLDLNDAHTRRKFLTFLIGTFFFIAVSAFGSYRAFEYTESVSFCGETCHTVMSPEHTTYMAGAHARVRCVDCHVGAGADWYVRSKLSGAYQLYSVAFEKYSRPIQTPVHNLRPAPETCEQCHWPEKFFGAQMKIFKRYGIDEKNSLTETRMLINVGGGSPVTGQVEGIHWHISPANEVTYIATDEKRQQIPWVRVRDKNGNVEEYFDRRVQVTPEMTAQANHRKMDCVDCHNRPAHVYVAPEDALDKSFGANRLDTSIPFLKRQALDALTANYETTPEAVSAIETRLTDFYRSNYSDLFAQRHEAIRNSILEIQRIYQTFIFPEMKTDWRTHPNNAGHIDSVGCFRCHDGNHVSKSGKVISNDCTICHVTIFDSTQSAELNMRFGPFVHPVDLGGLSDRSCTSCHVPGKKFIHPVNLGDISMFQCSACHPRAK